MNYRFSLDKSGGLNAEFEPGYEALGWFLEGDVQGSPEVCEEILRLTVQVRCKEIPGYEGTGNSHTIIIKPETVRIETEFAEPKHCCEVSSVEFEEILRAWKEFLKKCKKR